MLVALATFPNDGRKLKNFIQGLLSSWIAACVNRINYVKSYYIWEEKLTKEEEKILIIKFPKKNKEKLTAFMKKNHPYKIPELIFFQPEDVDKAYLDRVLSEKPLGKKWDKNKKK